MAEKNSKTANYKTGVSLCDQSIGKRIKELREQMGLTQKLLGERIGISPELIKKLEYGDRGLTLENARSMKKVFQVPYDYLLDGKRADTQKEKILLETEKLTIEERKELIIEILKLM